MGNYAKCWLDDLFVGSSKNDIDTEIISLFRPQDKIIASRAGILPNHLKHYREELNEDSELKVIYYEASIDVVRDRLNVLGYDLATAKEAFRAWISEQHNHAHDMADEWEDKDSNINALMQSAYKKECEILSTLTRIIHEAG